jgi:hypothetical protein
MPISAPSKPVKKGLSVGSILLITCVFRS